jgi:hypothetical protein
MCGAAFGDIFYEQALAQLKKCTRRNCSYTLFIDTIHFHMNKRTEDVMACNIEQHKMHMCALKAEKNDECIKTLSDKPTVVCGNCGAKANSPDNVCAPQKLT